MAIFEVDGQQYEVEDRYSSDFAKEYPNAVTRIENDDHILEVSASDYPEYLESQKSSRRVVPEKETISGSSTKPYQITPEDVGFENVLDRDNFQERYGVSPSVMERQTDPIKDSVQRLRAKVGKGTNIGLGAHVGALKAMHPMISHAADFAMSIPAVNDAVSKVVPGVGEKIRESSILAATENELRGAEKAQSKDGFWKSFGKGLANEGMWTQGLSELDNNITLSYIAKKAGKEGFDKLPEREQDLLTASALRIASEAANSDEKTAMQIAGMSTAESMPYMLQFLITSPVASLATTPVRAAIKTAAEKAIKSGVNSKLASVIKGAARTAAVATKAGAMSAMQPTMYADAVSRGTGKATIDENGKYAGMEDAESAPVAAYKAFANATVENLSEHSGTMLSGATGAAARALKKVPALGGFITNVQKNNVLSGATKMMKAVGFNGAPEEFFEEQVSTGLNSLIVGDSQFSDFTNWKQQLATLISVGATAGAMTSTGSLMSVPYKKQIKNNYSEATDLVKGYFSPDEFDQFRASLSNMNIDSRPDFISSVAEAKGFSTDEVKDLTVFATRQAQYDGYAGAVSDYIEEEKVMAQKEIDRVSNKDMGEIVQVKGFGGNPVNIVGGFVVIDENGFVDKNKSSQTLYYLDENGKRKMTTPDKFGQLIKRLPLSHAYAAEFGKVEDDILIKEENDLADEESPEQAQQDAVLLAENGNQVETPEGVGTISQVEQDENAAIVLFPDGRSKRFALPELNPAPVAQEVASEVQQTQAAPIEEENTALQTVESDVAPSAPVFPVDKENNIDYSQIQEPEMYAQALQQEFEGDAVSVIDEQIQSAQARLEKAGNNSDAIKRRRAMKSEQAEVDRLNKVKAILSPSEQIVNEMPAETVENEESSPGEESNMIDLSQLTEPERRKYVAENSTDPIELADLYNQVKEETEISNLLPWEAALLGRRVSKDSFIENSDKNNITGAIARSWIADKEKAKNTGLDVIASELSEYGVEVTPNDIVDFILSHPSNTPKKRSSVSMKVNKRFRDIAKELTGENVGGLDSTSGRLILAGLRAGVKKEQENQAMPFDGYTIPSSVINFIEAANIDLNDFSSFDEFSYMLEMELENGTFVFPLSPSDYQTLKNIINHGKTESRDFKGFSNRVEKARITRAIEPTVSKTAEAIGNGDQPQGESGVDQYGTGTAGALISKVIDEPTPEEIAEIEAQLEKPKRTGSVIDIINEIAAEQNLRDAEKETRVAEEVSASEELVEDELLYRESNNDSKSADEGDNLLSLNVINKGEIDYDKLKEISGRIESGGSTITRLNSEEERGRIKGGRRAIEASILTGETRRTDRRGLTPSESEDVILKKYAEKEGIFFSREDIENMSERKMPSGAESEVYESKDGKSVIKIVNYKMYSDSPLEFLDNRVSLNNYLFNETPYALIGFTETKKGLSFVLTQPFIQGRNLSALAMTVKELVKQQSRVAMYMKDKFDMDPIDSSPTSFSNGNYVIEDLHLNNVKEGADGNLYFIDSIISLNEPSDNLGGHREYEEFGINEDELMFRDGPSETEQIKAEAEKNGTFLKAPNGKDSNLNEKQWLQVRTKTFKEWFGDWENDPENASKVVDENGEPLVVYHGTGGVFTAFDKEMIGSSFNQDSNGFFFTNNLKSAEEYANSTPWGTTRKNGNVMGVFLSISKPYTSKIDFDPIDEWDNNYESYIDKSKKKKADGIIVKAKKGQSMYVAFEPNQIKSATDNTGEFSQNNDDIRFRDAEESLPEVKEGLVVLHNISSENLVKASRVGGLAMPSLAITKSGNEFLGFGDITLIGDKKMIDPKNKSNKVFGADAYTPTYPNIEYKVNNLDELHKETDKLPDRYRTSIENALINNIEDDGDSYLYENRYVRILFALSKGADIVKYNTVKSSAMSEYVRSIEAYDYFDIKDKEAIKQKMSEIFISELSDNAKSFYEKKGLIKDGSLSDDVIKRVFNSTKDEIRKEGTVDSNNTYDSALSFIEENNLSSEIKKYASNLYEKLDVSERIFKGYSQSGKRQYTPHTVENAVKDMRKEGMRGVQGMAGGLGRLRARLTPEFKSVDEIKSKQNKLKNKEDLKEAVDSIQEEYYSLHEKLKPYYKWNSERIVDSMSDLEEEISDLLKNGSSESFDKLPVDIHDEIKSFAKDVVSLPTEYFEAKPQRAVYLGDFSAALIPSDSSDRIRDILNKNNIPFKEYSTNEERVSMVQELSEDMGLRFKESIFYSNAENAVKSIKQDKATPEQWLKMIEKTGGLKAGEDKWMGLSEWLKNSEAKTLTKQEVLDFINQNKIVVEEVELGEGKDKKVMTGEAKHNIDIFDLTYNYINNNLVEGEENYDNRLRSIMTNANSIAGFEWVETLDDLKKAKEMVINASESYTTVKVSDIDPIRLDYSTKGLDNKREIVLTVPSVDQWNETDEIHFGTVSQGREIGWIRFGETTDSEGNRVMVIDEIQSKRHQEGRENGYTPEHLKELEDKWNETREELSNFHHEMRNKYSLNVSSRDRDEYMKHFTDEEKNKDSEIKERLHDLSSQLSVLDSKIPDAPFDKNWHELAMKRALRYATENGFDKVAWTKGEQQAERYDLSKKASKIEYWSEGEGYKGLTIYDPKGAPLDGYNGDSFRDDQVSDILGKDLAERVLSDDYTQGEEVRSIEGDDLRIGGEGMKSFYDKMLPSFMNKYGKRWGVTVGEVTLPNVEESARTMHSVDVTEEMKASVMEGQPMFKDSTTEAKEVSNVEKEAATLADSLNTPIRVIRDVNEITNEDKRKEKRMRSAKGWYDPKTGEVVIVLPNAESVGDVQATILHEIVGHKGLRGLLGDKFEEMMDKVYNHLPKATRKKIMESAVNKYRFDHRTATEEYLAEFVEKDVMEPNIWQKIKSAIKSFFRDLGVNLEMNDADIAYLLWKSKNRLLKGDGAIEAINKVAKGEEAKERFREAAYTDADVLSDELDKSAREAWERLSKDERSVHEIVNETAEVRKGILKYVPTNENVKKSIYELTQGLFDNAVSLRNLQHLVNSVSDQPIESFANPYQFLTTIPARNENKMNTFVKTKFSKIGKAIKELGVPRSTVQIYAYLKHGLERNEYMRAQDVREKGEKLKEAADLRIQAIADSIEAMSRQLETADKKGTDRILAKIEGYNLAIEGVKAELESKKQEYEKSVSLKDYSGVYAVADLFIKKSDDREFTVAQIETAIEEFEKEHDVTKFWDAINGATKWTVQNEFEMGRISKDLRDKLFSMYKYYIPLKGWEEKNANEEWDYISGGGVPVSPIKKAGGRKSLASNLFENIGLGAQTSVMGGHKNLLKLHALRMVRNYPNPMYRVSEVWAVKEGDEWVPKAPEYSEDPEVYADNVVKFEEEMNELKGLGLANKLGGKLNVGRPITKYEAKEHEILVYENGKPYVIYINGNPDIARAINLTSTKPYDVSMNDETGKDYMKKILNGTYSLMRFTGQNLTSRNPAFVAANLVMDSQWAIAAATAKEGSDYARKLVGNYMSPSIHRSIMRGVRGKLDESNPIDKLFGEFQRAGGETGYSDLFKVDDFEKMIKDELKDGVDWRKAYTWYTGSIDTLNRWAELTSRFSTFVTSRNSGRDVERSAYDAKEITLNFNRKGTGAFLGNWLKFAYLFAGAGLQGTYSMANLALSKRSQKKITLLFASTAMLGFLVPLINEMFLGGDDDDLYNNKADYERKSNFLIRVPGKDSFVKIPIAQSLRPFYGIGESMYQMVKGNRNAGEGVMDIIGGFGMMLPFDPFGGSSLWPTFAQPGLQVKENKDFFGKAIYKNDSFSQYDPEFKRAYSNTSPMIVELTRALNDITGGDEVTKGKLNINPGIVEHLVEGYFGGAFKFLNDVGKQVNGAYEVSKGNPYPYDSRSYPIIGRFYTNTSSGADINAEYYKFVNDSEEISHRVKKYQDLGKKGDQESFDKSLELINSKEYQNAIFVNRMKSQIDNVKKNAKNAEGETLKMLKEQEKELKIMMLNEIEKIQ